MPFADTDGSSLKFVEESTYGTTPANSASWRTVRAKGWSIKPTIGAVESEEISSSVDVRDAVTTQKSGTFSVSGEYAKEATFETLLEHLFRSTFSTNVLKGGVLKKSLTFEDLKVGTANAYNTIAGCRIDSFSMSGSVGRIIETTFAGSGSNFLNGGSTSLVGSGSVAAVGTNRALSLADVTSFAMTGDSTTLCVLDFNLSIANNTREQFGAGSASLQGIGYGTRRVSGSFSAYFETQEQLVKLLADTRSDLQFVLSDGTNTHTWRLPKIKFMDAEVAVGGRSSDIVQSIDFLATYDTGQATTAMVTRSA